MTTVLYNISDEVLEKARKSYPGLPAHAIVKLVMEEYESGRIHLKPDAVSRYYQQRDAQMRKGGRRS